MDQKELNKLIKKVCSVIGNDSYNREIVFNAIANPPKVGPYRNMVFGLATEIGEKKVVKFFKEIFPITKTPETRKYIIDVLVFFEYQRAHSKKVAKQFFEKLN